MDYTAQEKAIILIESKKSFKFFVNNIFCRSFDKFIYGKYINDIADFMQYYSQTTKNTMRISARLHAKSVMIYAFLMWRIMFIKKDTSIFYFSWNEKMSAYHVAKMKQLVLRNPFFVDIIDMKRMAESVVAYKWSDKGAIIQISPQGLLGFKRGLHSDVVVIDDPYRLDDMVSDGSDVIDFSAIKKVNNIIRSQVLDIPYVKTGEIHIVGTPFSNDDIFFDKGFRSMFAFWSAPAVKDEKRQIALWPEYMDWDELMRRRETRGNFFDREYNCQPVSAAEGYLTREQILSVIDLELHNFDPYKKIEAKGDTIAGFDIGKKRHPSALSIFRFNGLKWENIFNKLMDKWDYSNGGKDFDPDNPSQIEFLILVIKNFGIDLLFYDNTRGEFESFKETGVLPAIAEPVVFSLKTKTHMATSLNSLINEKIITIQNESRIINHLLSVTNDLKSIETPEGHGDMFWSFGLAAMGIDKIHPRGDLPFVSTGGRSIIESGIPAGY